MTLLFSEGFGAYASSTDLANVGATVAGTVTYQATGGYNLQPCFQFTGSANPVINSINYSNPFTAPASNEVRFGFWLKVAAAGVTCAGSGSFGTYGSVSLFNSGATYAVNVKLDSVGKIGISQLLSTSTTYGNPTYSGITDLRDNQHHWVEVRAIIAAASGGTFQVWVDGTQEINQTAITNDGGSGLTATSLQKILLGTWMNATTSVTSHVMVWDTSGSGMIGYTGPSRIETITPNAAGDLSGLTPTSGANYTTVNETVPNFDTNYVESAIATTIDLYNYTTLSVTPASIKGVMVKTFAKNADVGSKTFRAKASSSAVIANGSTQTLTVAYKQFTEFFPVDPNTSAAWTKAGIDAAQFGVEVQT